MPNPMLRLLPCLLLAGAFSLLHGAAARAASLEVESRIEAVTVQLDRARVVRRAVVTLERGRHELVFPDLPVQLDRSSVTLEALDTALATGRPVFREVESLAPVSTAARQLTQELERLEQQRRIERDAVAVQALVLDVLRQSQLVVEPQGQGQVVEPGSVFAFVENRGKEALMAIRIAEQAIDRLDAEIDQKRRQLARLGDDPMRHLTLTVPVTAETAGEAALVLAYTVHGAGFAPSVEARLDVEGRVVTLTAMAEVSQRTGEDWQDVELALSTAMPSWSTAAPPTDTWYIDVRRDEPRPEAMLRSASPAAFADSAAVALDHTAFDVTYRITEPAAVAADGTTQRVTIETVELPVELVWRTVPDVDPAAYLTADMTYAGSAPLLPGPVLLQRDGQAVGQTSLAGLAPGEPLELGFGADPAVQVERRLVTDERAQSGLIGTTRRHERRFVVEAANRRPEPVEIELVERLPVSRDTRITVELLPATTPPTTTEHDRDQGVLAWRQRLEPGETAAVTFAYAVRHPADLDVTGF
jgi:uncharacterized protein (TIGR02231 family)